MKLTQCELMNYISDLTNTELYELKDLVDREINLSEKSIDAGEEVRK